MSNSKQDTASYIAETQRLIEIQNPMSEMNKKYELTEETRVLEDGTELHRIRALQDIDLPGELFVHKGDEGGWIEKEHNLSQSGKSWVLRDACVYGNAIVYDDARIGGEACVYECARVGGASRVYNNARIYGFAYISGNSRIYGNVRVYGNALVCGNVKLDGEVEVFEDADVYGEAEAYKNSKIYGSAEVYGNALISGSARIHGNAHVYGNSIVDDVSNVYGDVKIYGQTEITADACVASINDYATYKNTWSSGRFFTYTRSNGKWKVGCFFGTGEELIAKAYNDSKLSGKCYEAAVRMQEAIDMAINQELKKDKMSNSKQEVLKSVRNFDKYQNAEEALAAIRDNRCYVNDPIVERKLTVNWLYIEADKPAKDQNHGIEVGSQSSDV